jgi:hypothetical protein
MHESYNKLLLTPARPAGHQYGACEIDAELSHEMRQHIYCGENHARYYRPVTQILSLLGARPICSSGVGRVGPKKFQRRCYLHQVGSTFLPTKRSRNPLWLKIELQDINEDTAKKEFCGPGKRIDSTVMDQLEMQITQAKSSGNKGLKKELKRRYATVDTVGISSIPILIFCVRREWLLIEARNNHVKDGLQSAYAAKVPDGQLDVFCVSNKSYEKYSRKGNAGIVQDSGIPDLRRFCYKLTAEAQLHEARHFLKSSLFSLLNSIDMWASSASCRQVADIAVFDESAFRATCNLEDKVCRKHS